MGAKPGERAGQRLIPMLGREERQSGEIPRGFVGIPVGFTKIDAGFGDTLKRITVSLYLGWQYRERLKVPDLKVEGRIECSQNIVAEIATKKSGNQLGRIYKQ